jgi:hypothetical protein
MADQSLLCPSARCESGAILVGIAMPDGRIAYAADRLVIDEAFVQTAQAGRSPESRFRFASRCAQGACRQWTGQQCGVIERVLELAPASDQITDEITNEIAGEAAGLPVCSIRMSCRWYQQRGATACSVCSLVLTDNR